MVLPTSVSYGSFPSGAWIAPGPWSCRFSRLPWAMPLARWRGPGSIACGDHARFAVLALAGDDPYRFRPPGGQAAPAPPSASPLPAG